MTHTRTHNSVAYACVTYDLVGNDLDPVFSLSLMGLLHGPTFSLQIANLVADLDKLGWRSDWPFIGPCNSPNRAVFTPTRRLPIRPKISRQCLSVGRADFLSRGVSGLAFELAASQTG